MGNAESRKKGIKGGKKPMSPLRNGGTILPHLSPVKSSQAESTDNLAQMWLATIASEMTSTVEKQDDSFSGSMLQFLQEQAPHFYNLSEYSTEELWELVDSSSTPSLSSTLILDPLMTDNMGEGTVILDEDTYQYEPKVASSLKKNKSSDIKSTVKQSAKNDDAQLKNESNSDYKEDWRTLLALLLDSAFEDDSHGRALVAQFVSHTQRIFLKERMDSVLRSMRKIGPYVLENVIGGTHAGVVVRGKHAHSGEFIAVKCFLKEQLALTPELKERMDNEISVLKRLKHPSIIGLLSVLQTERCVLLIEELCEFGDILNYMSERDIDALPLHTALNWFRQILEALIHCYAHHFCHRDLKLENVLLKRSPAGEMEVKLADFGFSSKVDSSCLVTGSRGSPDYAAPEIIISGEETPYDGIKADMWACGVMLYLMVVGDFPFWGDDYVEVFAKIKAGVFDIPTTLPHPVRGLLRALLNTDPQTRPSPEEALDQTKVIIALLDSIPPEIVSPVSAKKILGQQNEEEPSEVALDSADSTNEAESKGNSACCKLNFDEDFY